MVDVNGKWAKEAMTGEGFNVGDEVWVFYKFQLGLEGNKDDLWFPVETPTAGSLAPRYGLSDTWLRAVVASKWHPSDFDESRLFQTGIQVRYMCPYWFERDGSRMHPLSDLAYQHVHPAQVRRSQPPQPDISFLVFRWGGYEECDPVMGGNGGWGNAGAANSDRYMITLFEHTIWPALGPTYEVLTVFVQSGVDLNKLHAPLFTGKLKGRHKVGLYFLWPVDFQDNPVAPGFVNKDALIGAMETFEACGVVTRFPHHSSLYRTLLSKDWMAQLCLMPGMRVPITTKVPRSLIVTDPVGAARQAMGTLRRLHAARAVLNAGESFTGMDSTQEDRMLGVAKCGYSWEAMDVRKFQDVFQLAESLTALADQRLSLVPHVLVQEFIQFDVELRLFYVNVGATWDVEKGALVAKRPAKILYTRFTTVDEDGKMREFERMPRGECVDNVFRGDEPALAAAEARCFDLAARAFLWLSTDCAEAPPAMRLDFMVRHSGPGAADVYTGELTEMGASFLGWPEGPEKVFGALLASSFSQKCHLPACRCGGDGLYPGGMDWDTWNMKCGVWSWRRAGDGRAAPAVAADGGAASSDSMQVGGGAVAEGGAGDTVMRKEDEGPSEKKVAAGPAPPPSSTREEQA